MLENLMADILGLERFDEDAVAEHLDVIHAYPDRLDITLKDGTTVTAIPATRPLGGGASEGEALQAVLSNEKYKGDALLQKTYTADFLTKTIKRNDGEVAQYYVTGNHEPIIDPGVWDQVQYEIATRHGEGSGSKLHLFSSRLKCADCGGWYGWKTWSSTTNKHTAWHFNNKHAGDHVCPTPTLRDHQIKTAFLAALSQLSYPRGSGPS
ncbi:recombinase zinc beta ribbon domain-containing protein [Cutibacterium porci]|uniref:recombinase zinc beta ribbon domain-containing protein n=1 Tax=Cutibacterium porci TaxID=2605781 RepID=UPI002DDA3D9D|nr:recombinase zinc beta ribbon domain-containing protein [Cutibacterium porci]